MANDSKYIRVGSITKNEKEGRVYRQLVLDKEFLDNAKVYIKLAFEDKNGGRRFALFEPFEGAPEFIEYNVCVKRE